jgi:hypothetical protein
LLIATYVLHSVRQVRRSASFSQTNRFLFVPVITALYPETYAYLLTGFA